MMIMMMIMTMDLVAYTVKAERTKGRVAILSLAELAYWVQWEWVSNASLPKQKRECRLPDSNPSNGIQSPTRTRAAGFRVRHEPELPNTNPSCGIQSPTRTRAAEFKSDSLQLSQTAMGSCRSLLQTLE